MANTFTMIGPSGAFPGHAQPTFPSFPSAAAPVPAPPPGLYTPIKPLPGGIGPSSTPL